MSIAILGWGSLIWDQVPAFDEWHRNWQFDGPTLKIEFSRVSKSRCGALTLVLDSEHGAECTVAYAFSKRESLEDAICDLRCREGTTVSRIGVLTPTESQCRSRDSEVKNRIKEWSIKAKVDSVIWTDLPGNFAKESNSKQPFDVSAAVTHLRSLDAEAKVLAAEYIWRAPSFVRTPVRDLMQIQPWFDQVAGNTQSEASGALPGDLDLPSISPRQSDSESGADTEKQGQRK
jgi:hypothetical protein